MIEHVKARSLLDIGCGSGRCFPLYNQLEISEVVAQDVSSKALKLCKDRFPKFPYKLFHGSIQEITYPEKHFDIIISSRVLSAVLPTDIQQTIEKIGKLSKFIYINEMTDVDYIGPSTYWFKARLRIHTEKNNFVLEKKLMHGKHPAIYTRI